MENIDEIKGNDDNLINEDSVHPDNELKFSFANQEGPLDLLLFLIKKSKVEIEDIKLADITDQYLEYLNELGSIDMERTSDFVVVASELIEIKSRSLLPREPEDLPPEEDLDFLMKQRLKEYAMLKETNEQLKVLENTNRFYKKPEPEASKFRVVLKDMQLDMLLDAFTKLMLKSTNKATEPEAKEVAKEKYTVEQKIAEIKDNLLLKNKFLFSELFLNSTSRLEIVTTFMALLEMLKLQEIKVQQSGLYADIEIIKASEDNNG